jgi:hypothetical protein
MTSTTIPLSDLVQMLPGVISAGGAVGQLTGLVLTQNPAVPYGTIYDTFTAAQAQSFFGAGTPEAIIANNYFPGTVNCRLT